MSSDSNEPENLFSLDRARKKKQEKDRKETDNKHAHSTVKGHHEFGPKWLHWVKFFMAIVVAALLMRSCGLSR